MRVLGLELSTGSGSIAMSDETGERFCRSFANDRKHSGAFYESVESCLQHCGVPEKIVVGLGPGSYAGIRIAIATAIGLAAATAATLVGVPSICAMATAAREYLAIGDARRNSFFYAYIVDDRCVEGPVLFSAEELSDRLAVSRIPIYASSQLPAFPRAVTMHPSASRLVSLAQKHCDLYSPAPILEPIYLREPHITIPKFSSRAFRK
ncbi:MAG: tRNA (adenosine(37)-N6)-threonylcarbamoyltransferase complex dimerization subunit type 1 TsaB [Chthoniobacterales bacterium]